MDRKAIIQRRSRLQDRKEKEKAIVEKLLPFLEGKVVAAYVPIQNEVDVYSYLKEKIRYLPRTDKEQGLFFEKVAPDSYLHEGHFHVMEPAINPESQESEIEVYLVPMVGFSSLNRLGYGKGYYDRYFQKRNGLKIGIAFEIQECDYEPREWDIPMDLIVTEKRIISCES